MKYGAQTDVFRMIPGLENAAFARLGGIHRNTFLNSPRLLDGQMRLRPTRACASPARSPASRATSRAPPWASSPAASPPPSAWAGRSPRRRRPPPWAPSSRHITGGADAATFQPMNVNFGLFPPLDDARGGRRGRRERYKGYTDRAKADFAGWLAVERVPA